MSLSADCWCLPHCLISTYIFGKYNSSSCSYDHHYNLTPNDKWVNKTLHWQFYDWQHDMLVILQFAQKLIRGFSCHTSTSFTVGEIIWICLHFANFVPVSRERNASSVRIRGSLTTHGVNASVSQICRGCMISVNQVILIWWLRGIGAQR